MLVALIAGGCVLLFLFALVAPRLSFWPQRKADRSLSKGERAGLEAPGKLGTWLAKPFRGGRKAVDASAKAGRKTRWNLPF